MNIDQGFRRRILLISLGLVSYCGLLVFLGWFYSPAPSHNKPYKRAVSQRVISVIDEIPQYLNQFQQEKTAQSTAVKALARVRQMLRSEAGRLYKSGYPKPLLHRTLDGSVQQFLQATRRGNQLLQSAPQMLLLSEKAAYRREAWLSSARNYCQNAPQAFEVFLQNYRNWIRKPLAVGGVYSPQRSPQGQWEQRLYKLAYLNSMVLYANSLPLKALCNLELRASKKSIEKAMASLKPIESRQRGPLFEAIKSRQLIAAKN